MMQKSFWIWSEELKALDYYVVYVVRPEFLYSKWAVEK